MAYKLSERSIKRMSGVDPRLQEIAQRAIEITAVDFGVPKGGGRRTAEQQNALYRDGASRCDGYTNRSNHQPPTPGGFGAALDFYAYKNGEASWVKYDLTMVAAAFLQAASELGYSLEWGGLWRTFPDFPHVQLVD
jgi:peptidoglycan LD-endopeptidase CwlK